jgi:hypothetical protein
MHQSYQTIHNFFDCYGFCNAKLKLSRMIKTADSGKSWNGRSPSELLYFTEKLEGLIDAVYSIVHRFEYRPEIILSKNINEDIWNLTDYPIYCGWYGNSSPWDFFPRHLSKKEFLNPYKALEKFTKYTNHFRWKDLVRDILFNALSAVYLDEFDNGKRILRTYIHLHKLIEATHLIEVRMMEDEKKPRKKWKDKDESAKQVNDESQISKS